jgi:phosphoglycolate phosphatase
MISNLLLDLDGTLTDPKIGIIRCMQYALVSMGQEAPKTEDLIWIIGPPLFDTFNNF